MTTTTEKPLKPIPAAPRVRTVRVALAGCGAVGGALVRLIQESEREVAERYSMRFELARVLVRDATRPRAVPLAPGLVTADLGEFLSTPAEVVVEAIGGVDAAAAIARAALRAGRRLVTANKALLAAHGPELLRLSRRHRARLDFESAVGGGIPVIRALRDQLAATEVQRIRGVLNGTTNYILTRMGEGFSYVEALADAQQKGYAEANPSRDVNGQDAADKIRVLAWLAFGAQPQRLPVRTRGIAPHAERLTADAAALGRVVRLVAECASADGSVSATVEPVLVSAGSELGAVQGADNAVIVESRWNGVVRLAGPGAGGAPTASAILGDLIGGGRALRLAEGRAAEGVEEASAHRWLFSAPSAGGAETRLQRTLERAGIVAERLDGRGVVRLLTAPVPWARADLAARALGAAGVGAVVARVM
jgi:homoserine dehydrogenase